MFRLRLEAEGIPAIVQHEHQVGVYWPYALALGGAHVQVFHFDRDVARSVERRCLAGDFHSELSREFGDLDDDKCPSCGSLSFTTRPTWPEAFMLVSWVIAGGIIFPLRNAIFHCRACDTIWQDESLKRKFALRLVGGTILIVSAIWIFTWAHLL